MALDLKASSSALRLHKLLGRIFHWRGTARVKARTEFPGASLPANVPTLRKSPRMWVSDWQKKHIPYLTHKAAAKRLVISEDALYAIKRGTAVKGDGKTKQMCSMETLERVAREIGCRPEDLELSLLNPPQA